MRHNQKLDKYRAVAAAHARATKAKAAARKAQEAGDAPKQNPYERLLDKLREENKGGQK